MRSPKIEIMKTRYCAFQPAHREIHGREISLELRS